MRTLRRGSAALFTGLLLSALVVAAPAGAHKLSIESATRKTEKWAGKRCEKIDDCVRFAGRYCYPLTDHKRRCTAQVIRRLDDGDLIQCQTRLIWKIKKGSRRPVLARVGDTRCD